MSAGALFDCPVTGQKIQGLVAEETSPGSRDGMVTCLAFSARSPHCPVHDTVLGAKRSKAKSLVTKKLGQRFDCQALIRLSATRSRRRIRREVSRAMVPDCAS